jgi:hypothetical protein
METDEYLTTKVAATILSLDVGTIYKYRERGTLGIEPAGTFGPNLMWRRSDVERLARLRAA